jgi:hypothetical protein
MATKDMRIIVTDSAGTTILPLYKTLSEKLDPIESKNITLDGTLYTDFINNRRAWVVGWEKLKAADYDIIRAIYNRQYTTENIPIVFLVEYGISAPMKLEISDRNIRLNGEIIEGVTITLLEQYAVS